MKKLCWSIIIKFYFIYTQLFAQNIDFQNKTIGILISRKNLFIDDYSAKFWASYLQINDSLGLSEENLKTAVSIKLGQLITQWFKLHLKAYHVYFLNEGKQFENLIKDYPFHAKPSSPLSFDYIFCIDQVHWLSKKEKILFTVSNKMLTEIQTKMYIQGKIAIYRYEPFGLVKQHEHTTYETSLKSNPIPYDNFSFKIEKLLASWLNDILSIL
jgi:hypothetical protein